MDPQDYSARTAYRPQSPWYRGLNKTLGAIFTSLGLAPSDAVTLEVRGRRSGKVRRIPILQTPFRGESYLVSLAGESEWVRNVRAASGRAVVRRRKAYPVELVEIHVHERPPVIAEYLRRGAERGGSEVATKQARFYFGLGPNPSLPEIEEIASFYPVFRVDRVNR